MEKLTNKIQIFIENFHWKCQRPFYGRRKNFHFEDERAIEKRPFKTFSSYFSFQHEFPLQANYNLAITISYVS